MGDVEWERNVDNETEMQIGMNPYDVYTDVLDAKEAANGFVPGDIVDWEVYSSGGPSRLLGEVRCEVIYSGTEVGLRPLDWDDFFDVAGHEDFPGEWDDLVRRGVIDNQQPEQCTLVTPSIQRVPGGGPVHAADLALASIGDGDAFDQSSPMQDPLFSARPSSDDVSLPMTDSSADR